VVKAVQVLALVRTYMRLLVVEPIALMNRHPGEAAIVGTPPPNMMPVEAVLENSMAETAAETATEAATAFWKVPMPVATRLAACTVPVAVRETAVAVPVRDGEATGAKVAVTLGAVMVVPEVSVRTAAAEGWVSVMLLIVPVAVMLTWVATPVKDGEARGASVAVTLGAVMVVPDVRVSVAAADGWVRVILLIVPVVVRLTKVAVPVKLGEASGA